MKKKPPRIRGTVTKWQSGAYQRKQHFHFELPLQFLMLCKITGITPEQLLVDFMDNLSCSSWKREGRDRAKQHLVEYFIEHGYGNRYYPEEDIRAMFREMEAVGTVFPRDAESELLDLYAEWRDKHQEHWFNKWFNKYKREAHL
jgi:hypothetical protein